MENRTIETAFFDWLSKRVSPTQLSNFYTVFADVNEFCLSRKVLKSPLFQTTDISILSKVRATVESDKAFAFKYKKQRKQMIQGVHYYISYIKESYPKDMAAQGVSKEQDNETDNRAEPENLHNLLVQDNIQFVDNRNKQGCLWIIGGEELKPFVEKYKAKGVLFHYKEGSHAVGGQPAWWTNDEIKPSFDTSNPADNLEIIAKENRAEFTSWMMKSGIGGSSVMKHLLYLKKCGECAVKSGFTDKDIYAVKSFRELTQIRVPLVSDAYFNVVNNGCSNHLMEALALFAEFLFSKQEKQTESNTAGSAVPAAVKNEINDVASVSDVLADDLFAPLCAELSRQNIKTVGELKSIKLWQFMNRYDLYSIAMRQTIFDKVQAILYPKTSNDEAQQYKLQVGESVFYGTTPATAYLSFCEYLTRKYPLRIRGLIGKSPSPNSPVALHKADAIGNNLKLVNPTAYISHDLTADVVIQNVTWLFSECTGAVPTVKIASPVVPKGNFKPQPDAGTSNESKDNVGENNVTDGSNTASGDDTSSAENDSGETTKPVLSNYDRKMIARAEGIVLAADLEGITYDGLRDELDITAVGTKKYASLSDVIIEIKSKLYHVDAIIDWDEGAEAFESILEKLMQKNSGYVSSVQLYDYARVELNMFLNDNDFNNERAVFDIAQHLFSKVNYHDKHYSFIGKMHISKATDTISNNFDIFCKFASDQGGLFEYSDLVDYLASIGIKAGNLRAQLKLYTEPHFFYINEGELISADSMQIDDTWKNSVKKAIDRLFDDVGEHIILRDIQPIWFDQLPSLPAGRRWTPLLLQSVLKFWSKEFGARTIMAMDSQGIDTLHTMLVHNDSVIQNFGDVVICYLLEAGIEERIFEAEELRTLLIGSHMIRGNELIYNMSKALGGDERFAWDIGGNNVTIRV